MLAYLFPIDDADQREVVSIERDEPFTLEEMQSLVGGYVEIVTIPRLNMAYGEINIDAKDLIMLVNEEGKLRNLQPNMAGTMILRANGVHDYAVGNVVICDSRLVK